MKIKTQVNVSLIIFVILAVLIIFSVYSSNNQFQEMNKKEQVINEIEKSSFELYFLENEYLLHSGTRPVEQWNSKYDELSGYLEELTVTDPNQQIVLNSLLDNHAELHTTFSNLIALTVSSQGKEPVPASQRVREFAASTLTGQTQMMMSKSSELSQMIKAENLRIHERNTLIVSFSLAALMIFVVINYLVINRSVLVSVSTLQKGAKKIGTGDLDTKIETGTSDELGELSLAITAMVSNLKTVLTSRSELEKEVAERKRAQEQLKESETRYREFFHTSRDCVFITSPDGRIIEFNDATLEMFGYDNREEMSNVSIPSLYAHSEDRSVFLNLIVRDGYVKEFPVQLKRRDGTVIDSLITAVSQKNPDGTIKALIGTARDITDRKRAEVALKESEQKFREIFNNVNDGIHLHEIDEDGRPGKFIDVNDVACEMLQYSRDEMLQHSPLDFATEYHSRPVDKILEELITVGHAVFETGHRRKDGTIVPVEINSHKITFAGRDVVVGVVRDITERKQAEEEIKRNAEKLARSNRDLRQFAYVASHDLQEPLRVVSNFVQLLQRRYKGKFDKDADEFMDFISEGSLRMQQLIQDLLAYSRVETLRKPFEAVDVDGVVDEVINDLRITIDETSAVVTYDPLPILTVDRTQIFQVFLNLIQNAIKFRKEKEPPKVHVSAVRADSEWIFSVRDNGIGIEPQYFNKIFTIFQQLHSRGQYPGTGIGLAIVKRIIERHGGKIWVESEPGKGSTFFFSLRVDKEV